MGQSADRRLDHLVTGKFISVAPYLCLCVSLGLLLVLMFSPSLSKILLSQQVMVESDEPTPAGTIVFPREKVKILQVEAIASLPSNRWMTYEIQLVNARQELLLRAVKESWRESGRWQEAGESGTWDESDTSALLNLRPDQAQEPVQVLLQVLEISDTQGQEISEPVFFTVTVRQDPLNAFPLWLGWLATAGLTGLSFWAVRRTGRQVIRERCDNKAVGGQWQGTMRAFGAVTAHRLVRVSIHIRSDPDYSPSANVICRVYDRAQKNLWDTNNSVKMRAVKSNQKAICHQGFHQYFLSFDRSGDYEFVVQVYCSCKLQKVLVSVRDDTRTVANVTVHPIRV